MLIFYARNENQASATTAPIANQDHWHAAYGVYICDKFIDPPSATAPIPTPPTRWASTATATA